MIDLVSRALASCCVLLLVSLPSCSRYGFDRSAASTPREAGVEATVDQDATSDGTTAPPDVTDRDVADPPLDAPAPAACGTSRLLTTDVRGFDALRVGTQVQVFAARSNISTLSPLYRGARLPDGKWIVSQPVLPSAATGKLAAAEVSGDVHLLYEDSGGATHVEVQAQGVLLLQRRPSGPITDLDLASDAQSNVVGVVISDLPGGQFERGLLFWRPSASIGGCVEPALATDQTARVLLGGGALFLASADTNLRIERRTLGSPCTSGSAISTPTMRPESLVALVSGSGARVVALGLVQSANVARLATISFDANIGPSTSTWTSEPPAGFETTLQAAVDAAGRLHVVTRDPTTGALRWDLRTVGGSWTNRSVTSMSVSDVRIVIERQTMHFFVRDSASSLHHYCQALP